MINDRLSYLGLGGSLDCYDPRLGVSVVERCPPALPSVAILPRVETSCQRLRFATVRAVAKYSVRGGRKPQGFAHLYTWTTTWSPLGRRALTPARYLAREKRDIILLQKRFVWIRYYATRQKKKGEMGTYDRGG